MDKALIVKEGTNKYYYTSLPKEITSLFVNDNFEKLLDFIGKHRPYKNRNNIGSAYVIIRKKTNELLGLNKRNLILKTSKKEIASIRFYYIDDDNDTYVKIPFKIAYIFEAIINIVEDIEKEGIALPDDLIALTGKTYLNTFYQKHVDAYDACFNKIPIEEEAQRALNSDFHSNESPLNKEFR